MALTADERALLDEIAETLRGLKAEFDRFRPMLARYEQASKANGLLQMRRALKQSGDTG